ncbi:MAG: hypothetical protein HYS86_01855 [Candidatus Chisholmbacteria bacterium]|nr:hypothetical protein [Candidatus Chisholmbacteria bacterium]
MGLDREMFLRDKDAFGAGGGSISGDNGIPEPGPLELEFDEISKWLTDICPGAGQYTFLGSVNHRTDTGAYRHKLEIRSRAFGDNQKPYVAIFAGELHGKVTDERHPHALSWTLEVPEKTREHVSLHEALETILVEGYGASGLIFYEDDQGILVMAHEQTGKELWFTDISGPQSRDHNGTVTLLTST